MKKAGKIIILTITGLFAFCFFSTGETLEGLAVDSMIIKNVYSEIKIKDII